MSAFTGGPDGPISTERYQELLESEKRMNELEAENKALRRTRWGEVWYWQGDSEDHLESLNCPVLIEAETLRKMQRDHRETVRAFIFSEDQKREEIRGLLKEREMLRNRIADFEVGPDGGVAEQLRTHSERCTLGRLQLSAEIYNDVADLIAPHEARWQSDRQAICDLLAVIFRDDHEAAKRAEVQAVCLYAQSVVRGYVHEAEESRQTVARLRTALRAVLVDAERLNADIGALRVKRTSRDSSQVRAQNAWRQTIIDLIGPRTQRIADRLVALLADAPEEKP